MNINYSEFKATLDNLGFSTFYIENVSNRKFSIEYNKRNRIVVESVVDAGESYNFPNESLYQVSIDEQIDILDQLQAIDPKDLLLVCIEVFDWGDVQKSNILSAFNMYRSGELESFLRQAKKWFEDETSLSEPCFPVVWSSGWTKVYSFLCDSVTIYDSRVAAFLNKVLEEYWFTLDKNNQAKLKKLTSGLLSFGGNETSSGNYRLRVLDKTMMNNLGLYKQPNDKKKMLANKKASWFIRYLAESTFGENTQDNFRSIDKSAFMLGFDLNQW
ncbi:hypothetical protein [Vibrio parahaemolyticus]|uniref:hypothetical protein n=1 Tax=Vibrio parahaemolyticus TaxID=670 RepID=UPI000870DFBF|nr:hypothetical protein [Vibrio parahaemolyticus]AOV89699.1 hypothetical protein FORC23_1156 [Vibrio parahaemolyticus]HDZ3738462.1 hypothetical protein [Vibrio vulnificus]HEB2779398.1 hypothetical protein [Vibrio vulnificus]